MSRIDPSSRVSELGSIENIDFGHQIWLSRASQACCRILRCVLSEEARG